MADEVRTTTGWVLFLMMLGMMSGLLAADVAKLLAWNEALRPAFIAQAMAHFGVVIGAFFAGKNMPVYRAPGTLTRQSDTQLRLAPKLPPPPPGDSDVAST